MKLRRQTNAAFTMVEIAIALGVVAIALIAIIGVLPSGMQVNRDNRQETMIHDDGSYLLQAIRSSGHGVVDLSNFAEVVDNEPVGTMTSGEIIARMAEPNRLHTNIFRAITGPVTQRGEGVPSFRYMVLSEVRPVDVVNPDLPHGGIIESNMFEVRLVFLWPLRPNTTVLADSAQKQVFRTLLTGTWDTTNQMFNLGQLLPP